MDSKHKISKSSPSPKPHKKTSKLELEAKAPAEPSNRRDRLTVVGIGASAGGLAALTSFFDALSSNTGMSYVVVTHLHPTYESHMAELLQRHTHMPVLQVNTRVKVDRDHVYVIPPNRSIVMTDSHLETMEFTEPHGQRSPIDMFFRSLASEKREAIALILSGSGTDGSVGIKDIKELGGIIMVQHPNDAEYDSMPRAAINTGLPDVVLPAAQLAQKLMEFSDHRPQLPHDPGQLSEQETETLQRILSQVHARTGHDFNHYKRATILRRVERRMQLNGFQTLDSYLNYIRQNPNEIQSMFQDLLIGVTNFFRDRESWQALEQYVIPALFANRRGSAELRVWSIGCATGEEAYGVAILLFEAAERYDIQTRFQIFASDLDERSITQAREGIYPAAIEADVSPERLERFFLRESDYYRLKREVRDVILFTSHNVLRDPPFSRQDLIVCRNVLIYLQREIQDKVFDVFHYALNPGGFLFLGSSESAEHLPELFQTLDKSHRIYQSMPVPGDKHHVPPLPINLRRNRRSSETDAFLRYRAGLYRGNSLSFEEQHEKSLEMYGPPSVIINEAHVILHVSENAGRYLLQPRGPITGDVLKLVRPELQMELQTAIFHAFEKDRAVLSAPVFVQFNGHPHRVILAVRPRTEVLGPNKGIEKQALILFLENELDEPLETTASDLPQGKNLEEQNHLVIQLQNEVQHLREQLQVTIEEYDSSNEEMKAANEEMQSTNEEYRSATEELETSKEELQSVNEELQTVNNDMKNKLDELSQAHQELENLLGATEIGTLFLNRELRIQRFTSGVHEVINILPSDRDRPIGHLTHKLKYNNFMNDAEQVLRRMIPLEREAQTQTNEWYLLRFRPYLTTRDQIQGVVITFINITALKHSEEELLRVKDDLERRVNERTAELAAANEQIRQARDMFLTLFYSNPIPTSLTHLPDGMFIHVNDAFLEFAGLKRSDVIGHTSFELGLPLSKEMRPQMISLLQKERKIRNIELKIRRASGELATVLASIQMVTIDPEHNQALLMSFTDISDRVKAEQQVRSLAYDLTTVEQEERRRISEILHDDLQQRIFAVKMQLQTLFDAYSKRDIESAQVDFNHLMEWLDESIAMTRNLSIDLSPAVLQGDGLVDALTWLSSQMYAQYGLEVTINSNGLEGRFQDTLRILLFQIVRELLFNIVKHANTLHARIDIERVNNRTCIIVSDEGTGFDAAAVMDDTLHASGLLKMQHRLNLMGCTMQVKSQPDVKGTQVVIEIPLDK